MGYWYTSSLNLLVTVLKLKSASCWPLLSRQMFSSAGTMGVMSVPAVQQHAAGSAAWRCISGSVREICTASCTDCTHMHLYSICHLHHYSDKVIL